MTLLITIIVFSCSLGVFAQSDSVCSFKEGGYSVSWRYDANTQMVIFDLSAAAPENSPDFWTGVGFGPSMADMDFIGVFVRNGQIGLADTYTTGHAQPTPDPIANVQILNFDFTSGVVSASFARPVDTGDDKDKNLSECQTFQFPVSGGVIEGTGLTKHLVTPKNVQVCNIVSACVGNVTSGGPVIGDPGAALPVDQNGTTSTPINSVTDASNVSNPESVTNQSPNGLTPTTPTTGGEQAANSSASSGGDSCSFTSGNYSASWTYDPVTNNINFQLSTIVDKPKFWTGLGIGKAMANLDVLLAFVEDNVVTGVSDMKSTRNGEPERDAQQDLLYDNNGKVVDGRVQVSFSRPLTTTDASGDLPIDGDGCNTFQFPVSGGAFMGQNRVRKHNVTPVSKEVCAIKTLCVAGQVSPGGSVQEPTLSPGSSITSSDAGNATAGSGDGSSTSSGLSTPQSSATPTPSGESTLTPSGESTLSPSGELTSSPSGESTSTPSGESTSTPSGESTSTPSGESTSTTSGESTTSTPSGESTLTPSGDLTLTPSVDGALGTNGSSSLEPGSSTTSSTVGTSVPVCNPDQNDLTVCLPYFDEYFGRVDDWAKLHSVAPDSQYWKACKLIGEVANVKSLCCKTFVGRCKQYVS